MADAQSYYEHHFSISVQNGQILSSLTGGDECVIVVPMWFLASEVLTFEGNSLVIVPLDIKDEEVLDGRGMQMVFYTNEFDEIETEIVLYEAENYNGTRPYPIDNTYFSGFVNAINVNTKTSRLFPVQDGEILGMVEVEPLQEDGLGGGIDDRNPEGLLSWLCKWFGIGCGGCPPASGNGPGWGWSNLWNTFTGFFSGSGGGGSGGGGGSSTFWLGYSYSGFPFYNYGNGGGSGGGGGSSANPVINTIFDGTFFNGEGQTVANKLEELVADHDLMVCTETLHQELYHCLAQQGGEPLPPTGSGNQGGRNPPNSNPSELNISGYIYGLNGLLNGTSTECLSEVVSQYQTNIDLSEGDGMLMYAIQDNNNFDIPDADLFELVKNHCGSDGDCIDGLFECFNRLDNFQQEHGVVLNEAIINLIMASDPEDICGMETVEFQDYILELLFRDEFSKKPGGILIDLNTASTNYFGSPDPSGNYIDCSQADSATFQLTLYADQPSSGTREPYSGNPITGIDVGHTFISLSTNYGGTQKNITYGFYPSSEVDLDNPVVPMATFDDGGHEFSSSITI